MTGPLSHIRANASALFEPGVATALTVTALFSDSCDAGTRFRLRSLKLDVVGVN